MCVVCQQKYQKRTRLLSVGRRGMKQKQKDDLIVFLAIPFLLASDGNLIPMCVLYTKLNKSVFRLVYSSFPSFGPYDHLNVSINVESIQSNFSPRATTKSVQSSLSSHYKQFQFRTENKELFSFRREEDGRI